MPGLAPCRIWYGDRTEFLNAAGEKTRSARLPRFSQAHLKHGDSGGRSNRQIPLRGYSVVVESDALNVVALF
jgi:hypothetical protein